MRNKRGKGYWIGYGVVQCVVLILLILTFSLMWAKKNYGSIGMAEILFTLNMPLKGTSDSFLKSYAAEALLPVLGVFAVDLMFTFPGKGKLKKSSLWLRGTASLLILAVWANILIQEADKAFGMIDFLRNQVERSEFIENEYVDAGDVELTFPLKKRNIILIYVESGESSNQDISSGGYFDTNYIPEMTEIARENVSFSQSHLIEGAVVAPACGWTMAGLVANTAGLPLKLFKYDDKNDFDNSMGNYASFLPGVTTLGDILKEAGYTNYFMAGSDFEFGGRESYFTQHGDYQIWDYNTAMDEGRIDKDYYVWWGFEDMKLYEYAKEELLEIAGKGEPFNFSILTADTHHVAGYRCELCPEDYEDQYANVWACASRQLNDFVEWVKQQDFYENTTIVIAGDHCSMDPDFYGDLSYDKHHGEVDRKIYNAIIHPAVRPYREKYRKFTTMDMFPTALAAMGVKIEGDRLGLGTNLFSREETLAEKYGYAVLFDELDRKSTFYNKELLYVK